MKHSFGKGSTSKLNTCHDDLVKIMKLAITESKVDFGVSEGHRSLLRQKQLFDKDKSKIDGVSKKGKHNYIPSLAADIYIYHPDLATRKKLAYDKVHLAYVAGIIQASAQELESNGEITHVIRWGANWDSDGIIDFDQLFDDYPHFELIKK